MCALAIQGAAVADATAEYELRLSAFRLRYFLSFFPSSLPDIAVRRTASQSSPMPAIQAETSLARRFHRRSGAWRQHGPPAQAFEERRSANGYVRW
jgi:hypothetical protein